MFVYSVNKRQIRFVAIALCLVLMCLILAVLTKQSIETAKSNELNMKASDGDERIAYLSQFGWSVEEESAEVQEIIIPSEFDEVYENYNKLQLEQGFDLTKYMSKRV